MATKNLVPRATGEGQIGLSSKKWSQANFVTGNFDSLTVSGQSITGTLTVNGQSITGTIAGLSDTNITNPSSAQILVHDGTNSFDNVTLSGDATLSSAGVLTISNGVVTNDMLAGSIANSKLANSSVTINSNSLSLGGSLTLDTGDIGEGSNLYYTDERVDDRVNTLLTEGTGITLTYDDNANSLTIDASVSSNINSLTDVSITSAASNQLLQYNGSNWVNVKSSHLMVAPVVVTTAGDITTDNNNNRYKTYANNHYVYTNSGVTDDIVYWSLPGVNGHNVTPVSGDTIVIENMTSNTIRIVGRVTAGYVIERNTTLGQANGSLTTNIGPGTQVIIRYVPTSSGSLGNNGKWLLSWMPNAEIINPSNSTDATAFENSPIVWDKYTLGSDDFGRWVPQGMSSHDLQVRGYNSNVGELKLYKANNANYTSLKSTSSISSNRELTLPDETGTLATQTYVQNYVQGLDVKESVRVATTTGGTLSSSFENGDTIDGVALATGDRILIKDQAMDETQNGIYIVNASGAPTRADDLAAGASSAGCFTFVEEGTTNGDKGFVCTANSGSDVVGTHSISFTTFSSAGSALTDIVNDTSPQLGGNLDVNSRDIVSTSNGHITLTPNGTGVVRIDGTNGVDIQSGEISVKNSGSVSNIKLYCESSNAHYTQLQSAAHSAYSGNVTLTLPASTGTLVGSGDTGTVTNAMLAGSIVDSKLNTITTANKISLSALDLDGGTDIGADLVDADLIVVDDGAGGTNRKSALSRIKKYVYSAISGDATASDAGALTIASGAVETAMVNANVITGQTAETSIANDDLVLIYDTSESALRKMTKANFVSGLGGGGLANIVEDTTPQLGGTLDLNSQTIQGHLLSSSSTTYDIGSTSTQWRNVYLKEDAIINFGSGGTNRSQIKNDYDTGFIFSIGSAWENDGEPIFRIQSVHANNEPGPTLQLYNRGSNSNGDYAGKLSFTADLDDVNYQVQEFASIRTKLVEKSNPDKASSIEFYNMSDNVARLCVEILGNDSNANTITKIHKILDVVDHNEENNTSIGLRLAGTNVTATATELNLVDGSSAGTIVNSKAVVYGSSGEVNATTLQIAGTSITSTAAELNKLDGATVTTTELNVIDGDTSATSTTLVDADRVVVNDDGTMKQVAMTDVMTYVNANVSGGGGGGGGLTYSAINSNTTAQAEYHYSVDTSNNAVTLTLPAISSGSGVAAGKEIRVKLATAGNDLTIDGNSTETIDGSETLVLNVVNQSVTLVAGSSTNWEIV